jgi:hypothetical protein
MPSLLIDWSGNRLVLCIDGCKTARQGSELNHKPWVPAPTWGWNFTWFGALGVWCWKRPGCAGKYETGMVRDLSRIGERVMHSYSRPQSRAGQPHHSAIKPTAQYFMRWKRPI